MVNGPGTILSDYLKNFGIATNEGCSTCTYHRDKMNEWGPDKCIQKVDTIVRWLQAKALEQKKPFNKTLAKKFILFCCRKSKKALDAEKAKVSTS